VGLNCTEEVSALEPVGLDSGAHMY